MDQIASVERTIYRTAKILLILNTPHFGIASRPEIFIFYLVTRSQN
jgi:hypothetical protein